MFTIPNTESSPTFAAQSNLDSTDLAALVLGLAGTGLATGGAVTPNSGMQINVAAGSGQVAGINFSWASATPTAATASTTDRKDLVVVSSAGTVSIVEGTPCGTAGWTGSSLPALPPVKPPIPADSISLSELYIEGTGATPTTTVAVPNIVDKRVNAASLIGASQPTGVNIMGTVTTAATFPALDYSVAAATLTAGDVCAFVLPAANAVPGASFLAVITNAATGTVDEPTFAASGTDTLQVLGAETWDTINSAVNIVQFTNTWPAVWTMQPITNGLAAYLEGAANSSVSGTVAVPAPSVGGTTMFEFTLTGTTTFDLPVFVPGMTLLIDVVTAGYSYTFAAASGQAISYVGGAAPAPSAHTDCCAFHLVNAASGKVRAAIATNFA